MFHPLQHLLMIQFLNINIEQLFITKGDSNANINSISKNTV